MADAGHYVPAYKPNAAASSGARCNCKPGYCVTYISGVVAAFAMCGIVIAGTPSLGMWAGIIMGLTWGIMSVVLLVMFWNKRSLSFVSAILLAVLTGLIAGLSAGSFLVDYWHYDDNSYYDLYANADPTNISPSYIEFAASTYVKSELLGLTDYTENVHPVRLCAAPILVRSTTPQSSVSFWAGAPDCCSEDANGVGSQDCSNWNSDSIQGEVHRSDLLAGYKIAGAASADKYQFDAEEDAYYVELLAEGEHQFRQDERYRNSIICIVVIPLLWPLMALLFIVLRFFFDLAFADDASLAAGTPPPKTHGYTNFGPVRAESSEEKKSPPLTTRSRFGNSYSQVDAKHEH